MSLLETDNVYAGYEGTEILHGVSLRVEPGEVVTVIGPNGAGKSTLMKAIFGLVRVSSGSVLFKNRPITGARPNGLVQRGVSYVPQVENVFLSLTVWENLEMGAFTRMDDFTQRLQEVLQLFPDLQDRGSTKAGRLSGGQRQMVAMARALMLDPEMLLLDEPSAGLSPRFVDAIFERIVEINQTGVAILMVEQNARRALQASSRGYVLAGGQNRSEGTGSELLADEELGRLYLGG